MKKISLFVLLMLFLVKVNATEYEWKDSLNNNPSNYIIESEVRYKWYKNNFVKSIYELYNEEHKNQYNQDNYVYGDYVITTDYPEESTHREIISYTEEKTLDKKIFNTIIFDNLEINGDFTFDGILIRDKNNEKLNFDIYINYESGEEVKRLKLINQKLYYFGINAFKNKIKTMILTFENDFDLENIIIDVYYRSYNYETKKMNVYFKYNNNYYTESKEYIMNQYSSSCLNGYCLLTINTLDYLTTNYITNLYKYRDKLFRYDIYEKVYDSNYYSYLEGYEKDIETAKVFYRYKNQELCKIEDEIIGSINDVKDNKIAFNTSNKKSNIIYNYTLIFIIFFTTISVILYLLLILLKKLINKCRTK